jgi:hypothetical protein
VYISGWTAECVVQLRVERQSYMDGSRWSQHLVGLNE